MKKILAMLSLLLFLILTSCVKLENYLIISEYIAGDNSNQAIEIYNSSDKDVDLNNYSIGIYSVKDSKGFPSVNVKLKGIIEAKKTFVVVNSNADDSFLEKADLKTNELSFGGKEGISLMKNNEDLDVIGNLGVRNYNSDLAFVRKTWRLTPSNTFNNTIDYLYYNPLTAINYLGEFINSVTLDELLEGPKFVDDYLDMDFYEITSSYVGTGGAIEVTLEGNIDGDTSYFYFPSKASVDKYMNSLTYNSKRGEYCGKVRYQEVDTPETQVQNNKVEEFGWPAKLNTAKLQNEADHIYVQSNAKEAMVENYGRMLGYVFVEKDGDSLMVNFDTIKKGYSTATLTYNGYVCYKDCPYYNYFVAARDYAIENNLGIYGEKDPYWDYINNKSKQL